MGKEKKSFVNYRASAGSGKTYRLVLEYLALALDDNKGDKFKHILAITFTNKAAAEMKERILRSLKKLSKGENEDLKKDLLEIAPALTGIEKKAGKVLKKALHDYSHFSVMTIDSFINRLVRSFTYETDIPAGFDVELNFNRMNNFITRNILFEIGLDPEITQVILDFTMNRIAEGKSWTISGHITRFLKEFTNEKQQTQLQKLSQLSPGDFLTMGSNLKSVVTGYTGKMKELGEQGLRLIDSHGFSVDDFPWGYSGASGYLYKLSQLNSFSLEKSVPGPRFTDPKWVAKKSSDELKAAMDGVLGEQLEKLQSKVISVYQSDYPTALTARLIFENITLLGLIGSVRHYLNQYKGEFNVVPIYDLTGNVHRLIRDGDIPFIYYILGDSFEHIMIDEFQDTSQMQWDSLFPLIENSMSEEKKNLGVGDLKQSIYRWRGGVTDIMDRDIHEQFKPWGGVDVQNLPDNYRSRRSIVEFNNRLFGQITDKENFNSYLTGIYDQARQNPQGGDGGFVSVTFRGDEDEGLPELVVSAVERSIEAGYEPGDIAVISRRKKTGMEIASLLVESGYDIVTPELLELRQNAVSLFLINLLKLVLDPSRDPELADVLFFIAQNFEKETRDPRLMEQYFKERDNSILPECVQKFITGRNLLLRLPLYESVEELIRMFGLTHALTGSAGGYLTAFLDMINDYSSKEGGGIFGFLTWWEDYNTDYSIAIPEEVNGIILMTIHKAKGLEFPVVILPDTDWKGMNDPVWLEGDESLNLQDIYPPPYFVNHKKALADSLFSEGYRDEEFRRELDDLNLFYVACTRPREALFIFSEEVKEEEGKHSNYGLLNQVVSSGFFDENGANAFEAGTLSNMNSPVDVNEKQAIPDRDLISNRWSGKMTIGMRSEKFWDLIPDEQMKKIDRGILIHEVLSRINKDLGVEAVIGQMALAGRTTREEAEEIHLEILRMFESPEVKKWFFGPGEHMTEQPIITEQGTCRPDRIIISGDRATIIDFKTGRESDKDVDQMSSYKSLLREMGYPEVKGILYYLSSGNAVEV